MEKKYKYTVVGFLPFNNSRMRGQYLKVLMENEEEANDHIMKNLLALPEFKFVYRIDNDTGELKIYTGENYEAHQHPST